MKNSFQNISFYVMGEENKITIVTNDDFSFYISSNKMLLIMDDGLLGGYVKNLPDESEETINKTIKMVEVVRGYYFTIYADYEAIEKSYNEIIAQESVVEYEDVFDFESNM